MRRACAMALGLGTVLATVVLAAEDPPADADAPPKHPTVAELRKKYPLESLASRLAYEPAGVARCAKWGPTAEQAAAIRLRLDKDEMFGLGGFFFRPMALADLYSDKAEEFLQRRDLDLCLGRVLSGNLVGQPTDLELPEAKSVPFAALRPAASSAKAAALPSKDEMTGWQWAACEAFMNPNTFGYVRDRDHVAGFEPHQFRSMPWIWDPVFVGGVTPRDQWAVVRLELVSVLKFDRPASYVMKALPRMQDISKAPRRSLTPFEEKALKTLVEGDDVASESSDDSIHMLGAIRATKECLPCHQVGPGDLLGAFSWELQWQPAVDDK